MKFLLSIGSMVLLGYLGICLFLRLWQTRFIFFPSPELAATPTVEQLPYEEVRLPVEGRLSGGQLDGWWISAAAHAPVVLYFHGNGSNIGDLVSRASRLHRLGLSVLLVDYRGYGRSSGPFPNEARVYEDAEAAWRYLTQTRKITDDRIVLYGHSLGGAVALQLASHHADAAGVIVESSFTSMRDMVDTLSQYKLLPVDWILTQRFDSLARVRSLHVPLLLLHGTADQQVPAHMSQTLFAAAPGPKQLVLVPDADHSDMARIAEPLYLHTIQQFIQRYCPKASA